MRGTMRALACASAMAMPLAAGADLLWDNNIEYNEFNGRGTSPPQFPNIRVADDFLPAQPWVIDEVRFLTIETEKWRSSGMLEVFIYADSGSGPGPLIDTRTLTYAREEVRCTFLYCIYLYTADLSGAPINVDPGHYWIGFRDPGGSGEGSTYWLTSDGGPDGAGTDTGWFSLDSGGTWQPSGEGWHHAFEIYGQVIPAPGVLSLFVIGALGLRGRRRAHHPA